MNKFIKFVDNFEENIIAVLLPFMCILVFMSTFFRYTKLLVIPWGEELSRYLLVWIIFLGVGAGAKKGAHFAVEVFVNSLPKGVQKYFSILRVIIISIFCIAIIYFSTNIMSAQMLMQQKSPALNVPMWVPYMAVPVGCTLMIIRSIQCLLKDLKDKNESISNNSEEAK